MKDILGKWALGKGFFIWGNNTKIPLLFKSAKKAEEVLFLPSENDLVQKRVEGYFLDNQEAAEFLLESENLNDSIMFWATSLRFTLELISRERFMPAIEEGEAKWKINLDKQSDYETFLQLLHAMPPVCRSCGEHGMELLDNFMITMATHYCRSALPDIEKFSSGSDTDLWIRALFSPKAKLDLKDMEKFEQEWKTWVSKRKIGSNSDYRTCFVLKDDGSSWSIDFFLQKKDDTTVMKPYSESWKEYENLMLGDLGYASTLFEPLKNSLSEGRPYACALDNEQAHLFFNSGAALLEESGFGIMVPKELQKREKPKIKIVIKEGVSSGLLGFDSILNFDWKLSIGGHVLSEWEFKKLLALKTPFIKMHGKWVDFDKDELLRTIEYWKNRQNLTMMDILRYNGLGPQDGLLMDTPELRSKVLKDLFEKFESPARVARIDQPKAFKGALRPYQQTGFSWMDFITSLGMGCCLADDMGLGKTIQFIAFLLHRKAKFRQQLPSLLICPTSLVSNWEHELKKFAPSLKFLIQHGADRARGRHMIETAGKYDLVITTYALAVREFSDISKMTWDVLVLDEAQNIKNNFTKQASTIRKLRANTRIALTGTPVENRLSELWSIMDFLNPGFLYSYQKFSDQFVIPIERYKDKEKISLLRKMISPLLLRRTKSDKSIIDDIPKKDEIKAYCNLTPEQAALYKDTVEDMMARIEESEGMTRRGLILNTILKLKQICNHPVNLTKKGKLEERSGKLNRLHEMVQELLEKKEKCLIFTQYREMGSILVRYLEKKFEKDVLFLHGGVNRKGREEMIGKFQNDSAFQIFVLSLKAGGVGLNLTAATNVFHFDRWWNPAVENQATDRTYRIGQKNDVFVHKFICSGTIEEKIDEMIEKKKWLAQNVVGEEDVRFSEFSTRKLRELFSLEV